MAINVAGLVKGAFKIARALVPTALPECTLRLGPTHTINPVTETTATAWQFSQTINPVHYAAESERENAPAEEIRKSFAVPTGELDQALPLDETAEILEDGTIWHVYRVEPDPTNSLTIFHARRT